MKRIISLLIAMIAIVFSSAAVFAQQRTEVSKGVYVVTYGNVTVIENDNTQQTVRIKVQKKDATMYDILCGDTVVKSVAKEGLKQGIAYVVQSYTSIPKWLTRNLISRVVDKVYDGACNYFND